jgi:LacI family transcriptional regulator
MPAVSPPKNFSDPEQDFKLDLAANEFADTALPLREANPTLASARRHPRVLLIFNFEWDDAKAIMLGISRYAHGTWEITIDSQAQAVENLSWIVDNDLDGVITRHISPALVEACRARRIPLIDLNDTPVTAGVPKIRPDNLAVGYLGAEHFMERGFKHFAFCGLTETWAQERRAGFVEALALAGHSCDVLEAEYRVHEPTWEATQQRQIQEWLKRAPKPLAVMSCNDLRALQVLKACQRAGLLVPTEVAVLGANNDYVRCAFGNPPLSSVATDRQLAGYRAAELLDKMMLNKVYSGSEDIRIDPLRVMVRHSTDVLSVPDRAIANAIAYIKDFACQGISADDVARHVNLARHLLERRYRQAVGRSPHNDIRRAQIAKVKQLLIETDLPLKNITQLVGIQHTEYLNVLFRRHEGITPGRFRKDHQANMTPAPVVGDN